MSNVWSLVPQLVAPEHVGQLSDCVHCEPVSQPNESSQALSESKAGKDGRRAVSATMRSEASLMCVQNGVHGGFRTPGHKSTLSHTVAARGDPCDAKVMMSLAIAPVSLPRARRPIPAGNVMLSCLPAVAAVPGAVSRGEEEIRPDQ